MALARASQGLVPFTREMQFQLATFLNRFARWSQNLSETSVELCVFCRNNDQPYEFYTGHKVRDQQGRVSCPVLRQFTCPVCKATGDQAHTIRYCPVVENGRFMSSLSSRSIEFRPDFHAGGDATAPSISRALLRTVRPESSTCLPLQSTARLSSHYPSIFRMSKFDLPGSGTLSAPSRAALSGFCGSGELDPAPLPAHSESLDSLILASGLSGAICPDQRSRLRPLPFAESAEGSDSTVGRRAITRCSRVAAAASSTEADGQFPIEKAQSWLAW
ncbi:unnamed protein product [Protopolystoma xenopodis]|uniref:Nanos-type domain-containing protein n=1 Tax=Protopolystoma xenopodis TaxID=117903 RepID=A0A3S5A0C6_9PLAT|nr:unnamed protein product [Protopolystoma xenopodis]